MIKDYNSILGVNKDATGEEIKAAYRRLAKKYHPDRNKTPGAHDQFIEIYEAYEFLTNKSLKQFQDFQEDSSDLESRQEAYEKARRAAREAAGRNARMKYEKFQQQQEAFKKSGWPDMILTFRYIIRIMVFPLLVFFIILPNISDEVGETLSGRIVFRLLAISLLIFLYNRRINYFKLGSYYYSFPVIMEIIRESWKYSRKSCYYCKGKRAVKMPYRVALYKTIKANLEHQGAMHGHTAGFKRKYRKVKIPRSRKAILVHLSTSLIKISALILVPLILRKGPLAHGNLILGFFAGGIISSIILLVFNTRSKVSYIFSYGLFIKLIIWTVVIWFAGQLAAFMLLIDPIIEAILRFASSDRLFVPIFKQHPELDHYMHRRYQFYIEFPAWSVFAPILKWIF